MKYSKKTEELLKQNMQLLIQGIALGILLGMVIITTLENYSYKLDEWDGIDHVCKYKTDYFFCKGVGWGSFNKTMENKCFKDKCIS